jgi:Antibiotic biosynthesis monooxygenase
MIVEVSQFRLVQGADEGAFLKAADQTQSAFLAKQEGFAGRDLLRAADGSWMDIVRFESMQAAQAAFSEFAAHPAVKAFESMLETNSISMSHWSLAKSW